MDFFRLLAKDYPILYVDGVLSRFRIRGSNAGFLAEVQLSDKARIWYEIKNDQEVLDILPASIIFAYRLSALVYPSLKLLKLIRNKFVRENIAKMLYLFPYMIFKRSSLKNEIEYNRSLKG